ncbi:MAG TPA: hypothetical protein PLC53_01600 [Bacilli bacterium]|nr:hypothetical protein [Bacilli bacterium]
MASFNIHIAIGIRYIEKNNIKNKEELLKGVVAPDLTDDKRESHYASNVSKDNLIEYLESKVMLNEFLNRNEIDSDYNKGIFLHLITDFLFFNNFFDKNYISNISYQGFINDLYYSYDISNKFLKEKYNINNNTFNEYIKNSIKKRNYVKGTYNDVLPQDKLFSFIEYVSDINLEDYKNKILKAGKNVLP